MSVPTNPAVRSNRSEGPTARARANNPRREKSTPKATVSAALRVGRYSLVLLAGLGIGVFVTRQRQYAQEVLFSVNGAVVTREDLYHRLDINSGDAAVKQIIQDELRLQFAQREHLLPTAQAVEAELAAAQQDPAFVTRFAQTRQTPEDIRRAIRLKLAQDAFLTAKQNASEAEMRAFYAENIKPSRPQATFYMPQTIAVAVIVTRTEDTGREAAHELAGGVPFGAVAKRFSIDTSRETEGRLVPIAMGRTNFRNIPGFESTLMRLKVGQETGPVPIAGAWWIIHCLDKSPAKVYPYPEVREKCRQAVLLKKGITANGPSLEKRFAQFDQDADIKVFSPPYAGAVAAH